MRITNGALLFSTGLLHEVLGVIECRHELRSMWREGMFNSVGPENPMRMAVLWFLAAGFCLMFLGSLLHYLETNVERPLPRTVGYWLLLLALIVVIPMPRSGGWLVFPQAWLVFARAGKYRPSVVNLELGEFAAGAHHVDVKTIDSCADLRTFTASMLGYQPRWIHLLYKIRGGLVRLFGLRQPSIPQSPSFSSVTLPSEPGTKVGFFTLVLAKQNVWAALAEEKHLNATLAVVAFPVAQVDSKQTTRPIHVVTIVHYKHWTGLVYFNVIRPFHHLVVAAMIKHAARDSDRRDLNC